VRFDIDLAEHELTRLHHAYAASPDYDPAQGLADETAAAALLYSNLDTEQQAIFDMLKVAGVL
jgi:hypothetical protein